MQGQRPGAESRRVKFRLARRNVTFVYVSHTPVASRSARMGTWDDLGDNRRRGNWRSNRLQRGLNDSLGSSISIDNRSTIDLLGGLAIAGDVTRLTAAVASLASAVQRSAVRCSAVPRNVSKLAASIALHCLGLAIASEVIWSATLVAHC